MIEDLEVTSGTAGVGISLSLQEAAARAADDASGLPGEDLAGATAEDASHWVDVYTELLDFKSAILDVTRRKRSQLSLDASIEGACDEALLAGQAARYEERLAEWTAVRDRLAQRPIPSAVPLFLGDRPRAIGPVVVDPQQRAIVRDGRTQQLTPTEWHLLRALLQTAGEVVSREDLAERAWGAQFRNRRSEVEIYVSRLRRKVEKDPRRPRVIQTERGQGYRLVVDRSAANGARADHGRTTAHGSAAVSADAGSRRKTT